MILDYPLRHILATGRIEVANPFGRLGTILRNIVTKINPNSSQNPPKLDPNSQKSRFGGVRGALGRGLGAMVAPRRAQELQNVRKPRSRLTLGPPFGTPFGVLSALNFENGHFLSVFW